MVCLNRDQLVQIRTNTKFALAEKDRLLVDERQRRESAEGQRDMALGQLSEAQLKGAIGGTAGAVLSAIAAALVTYVLVRK